MKEKRYYIAYGSNLNVPQMRMRCPHATILGTAALKGWELLFKGSKTGSYVTAFAYIMHEERPIGIPTNFYMRTCLEGYDTFYFDKNILIDAYEKCREVCGYEG